MTERELVLDMMRRYAKMIALNVQEKSGEMSGTELNSESDYIPDFRIACEKMNMLNRPIGFVCKSPAGRVVKLLQVYDSTVYTQDPEDLPAQWGFVWSDDPAMAKDFIS